MKTDKPEFQSPASLLKMSFKLLVCLFGMLLLVSCEPPSRETQAVMNAKNELRVIGLAVNQACFEARLTKSEGSFSIVLDKLRHGVQPISLRSYFNTNEFLRINTNSGLWAEPKPTPEEIAIYDPVPVRSGMIHGPCFVALDFRLQPVLLTNQPASTNFADCGRLPSP